MMFKKIAMLAVLVTLLALMAVTAFAQGNGNGNNGAMVCDPEQPDTCLSDPQLNAYNYGGIGFVNPETGAQWNGQQRGQMGNGSGTQGTGLFTTLPPAYEGELPQEVIDLMIEGWMDEQHAYAVYEDVIAQFDSALFVNIQNAEAQHAAAWELLLDRYGIEVPALPVFEDLTFDTLEDACALGAEAEIANFALYDEMLDTFSDYPDIYQVALSLRNASEFNHLPAFESCAQ